MYFSKRLWHSDMPCDYNPNIFHAYACRGVNSNYTGFCMNVRNNAGTTANIGFDIYGNLDEAALLTHCGSGNGLINRWYNQSTRANANQFYAYKAFDDYQYAPSIVVNGVIQRDDVSGKPAIYFSGGKGLFVYNYDMSFNKLQASTNWDMCTIYSQTNNSYNFTNNETNGGIVNLNYTIICFGAGGATTTIPFNSSFTPSVMSIKTSSHFSNNTMLNVINDVNFTNSPVSSLVNGSPYGATSSYLVIGSVSNPANGSLQGKIHECYFNASGLTQRIDLEFIQMIKHKLNIA